MSEMEEPDCVVDEIHAELVAKEKEALEVIKEDICKWLSKTVTGLESISPSSFLKDLETGVALCRLVDVIQERAAAAVETGRKLDFSVPMASLSCTAKAQPGSFFARDNTANFIKWCRELGVEEAVIFESEGLVLHKDEKRVILCLLDVARFAEKVGISPPELVRMEREIELLEAGEEEGSPVEWEGSECEGEEEKEGEGERKDNTVKVTASEAPLSPSIVQLEKVVEGEVTPVRSKALASPKQSNFESVKSITPENKLHERTKQLSSSTNVPYTLSRIPIPVGGSNRSHHSNVSLKNIMTSTRKIRKRQRQEEEEDERSGEAKKVKRSPPDTVSSRLTEESHGIEVDKGRPSYGKAVEDKHHESVDEKVAW